MDANARLSANLQRVYTAYKEKGVTPLTPRGQAGGIYTPFPETSQHMPPIAEYQQERQEILPTVPEQIQSLSLPEIPRPQSMCARPPPLTRFERVPTANRLTQSHDPQLTQPDNIVYEYDVDDAAGIPSLAVFKKTYRIPTNRYGRNGACWRHIRQCTVQGGGNLLFVEGGIKEDDCKRYPPFGIVKSNTLVNSMGQRMIPRGKGSSTKYNSKAKEGFEYWYKEPKANITEPPAAPVRTISGHQFKIKGR